LLKSQRKTRRQGLANGPPDRQGWADVSVIGTCCYQLGYFPMINPVNAAIYAFGCFMLLALAIGFFAAPV
jgi:hypothetical protein